MIHSNNKQLIFYIIFYSLLFFFRFCGDADPLFSCELALTNASKFRLIAVIFSQDFPIPNRPVGGESSKPSSIGFPESLPLELRFGGRTNSFTSLGS